MKNLNQKPDRLTILLALLACCYLTGATTQLVDPTRPPDNLIPASKKFASNGPLQLTAIFIYPDRRMAIVSGQLAKPGDQIGAYTIINIQRDTVELKGTDEAPVYLTLTPAVRISRTVN